MHKTSSQKPVCDSSQCLTSLDHRFSDEIDKLAVYKTKSILCMAIHNSDGEVTGVVQAINKNPNGAPFTEDDEKGHNIFDNLCSKEYSSMMQLLKQAILSTDLTLYFQCAGW
ncbi:dual 3',5'-cyclic-AMP and -GMP phosphodiesterase 11A-like [Acipenser ruthenus]|uniref:dual 3',5'-cyclic-AMP and -GMP phosphodiesterase 11A-like n=1 Tax=Acipenser ruthenus TaxID=7906 RepID=UPI0027409E17|nr:dual 3',5'-cyclic-AMP and -GMP phosphodiesterase 11A-like [Acipenser ruthenus]